MAEEPPKELPNPCPFTTDLFSSGNNQQDDVLSSLPASFHHYAEYGNTKLRTLGVPAHDVQRFLESELCLGDLEGLLNYLWFAGAKRLVHRLHLQLAMGRHIAVADKMDLHLLWQNNGRVFIKPLPKFLLHSTFWKEHLRCDVTDCACNASSSDMATIRGCKRNLQRVALGFLYSYVCLISSEVDFSIANECRLLPRDENDATIKWREWKQFAAEFLESHKDENIHPRFLRAELRLSRINTISRLISIPSFNPYYREWRNYEDFFKDNLSWLAASTVFIALVLTAMQVGLATDRLQGNESFQRASYGFTVLSILGPLCALGETF
ncbi:hypothetical protein FPCIR_10264 [Fusarium pseudocircinatum]|uniref:Uncharacterized protein n=1 Tax=Fusarium pseudocircinatum TaxID=56676 RepID=A0A8H5NVX0_9HYPO|nr:hypothetical protein FPCIR_10264 [Fusarium pseudocircinatum]